MKFDFITPNDNLIIKDNDSDSIQSAIDFAVKSGENLIVIPRLNERTNKPIWIIDRAILLPSNFTVVLDNCHLKLNDGVYDNVFRNKNMYSDIANTREGEQRNIVIRGEGYAVLDGGKTNLLFECNYKTVNTGNPKAGMRVNNLILFHNVNGFSIQNIEVRNQRWWALNFIYCKNGNITDIVSNADNYIPNQDGIDLRQGCKNININRVSGSSGDDLIALTDLCGNDGDFRVDNDDIHISNVNITDVIGTSAKQGMVVLRNQDDAELFDIHIENVIHSNLNNENFKGYVTVRVGENGYFRKKESPLGSTRNICVKNVIGSTPTTLMVGATLSNCNFTNIRADGGYWVFLSLGVKMKDVYIKDVFYEQRFFIKQVGPYGILNDTNPFSPNGAMRKDDFIKNLHVDNYVNVSGNTDIYLDKNVENEIYLDGDKLC